MTTLDTLELAQIEGGNAVEDWGALAAEEGLNYVQSVNPVAWIPGAGLATIGAIAYYTGWAWEALLGE